MAVGTSLRWAGLVLVAWCAAACASRECRLETLPGWPAAREPASVDHRESTARGVRGVCLYRQSWRPRGAARGAVVLVHGLLDHSGRYGAFADALVARGYAVYAFDLRGHGRSGGGRAWVDDFDDYLTDLDRFVQDVRRAEPGAPVFLFGYSMGGAISTLYTLERRPPLAGLILSAPALAVGSDVSGAEIFATNFFSVVLPGLAVFHLDASRFSRDAAAREAFFRDPLIDRGNGPARTASQLLHAIERIQARMGELAVPVLALHGTADQITPPAGSAQLVRRARSTDRTLHLYPGLYHNLLHEPEAGQVTSDVLQWLDAHAPAPETAPSAASDATQPAPASRLPQPISAR